MGLRLFKTALVALAVLVGAYAAALGIGLLVFDLLDVSDREGANAMGLAFVICPAVALVAALAASIGYFVASGRSPATVAAPRRPAGPWLMAGTAAIGGFLGGWLLQWMLWGRSYETYLAAFAVSMAPWIGAIGLSGLTLSLARPRDRA
ncbi:hypothetical protein DFR52_104412 [Hoeflea marina]|uniref:Uncharacterized protein n=1 Tax=Hoeflea marina TaxID=274592 RepID=A0A317PIA7_9HYPH|nr:hypothetical protein [Hoeflea marina]PWV99120.1 hypothetical protein DFR52_104412 [Hoeflea marina]